MAALFLKLVPKQIEDIAQAVSTNDTKALKDSAHKLKGSCYAIGASRMAEICASLEAFPRDAPEKAARLQREFERVSEALEAVLA